MKYLECQFHCRFVEDAILSQYKGSMLRGILGASLRRNLCITRQADCGACVLSSTCVFPKVFNPASSGKADQEKLPAPFCIEPPESHAVDWQAGSLLTFTLKLFAHAVEFLPFFIHAFQMAGKKGVGKNNGKFDIASITQAGAVIYKGVDGQLSQWQESELTIPYLTGESSRGTLDLELETPLRFKVANQFDDKLDFARFFILILRRIRGLELLEGREWNLDQEEYARAMTMAKEVEIAKSDLHWLDWSRYSNRQQASMKLGGLVGRIRYEGPMGSFRKFLDWVAIVHIGKQTSFGLGKIAFHLK